MLACEGDVDDATGFFVGKVEEALRDGVDVAIDGLVELLMCPTPALVVLLTDAGDGCGPCVDISCCGPRWNTTVRITPMKMIPNKRE